MRNLFGSTKKTVGQNVVSAIVDCEQEVGIPECLHSKMQELMALYLNPEEYEIFMRGFGIGRDRQQQKEIAAEYGVNENVISQRAYKAILKLRKNPAKRELLELLPDGDALLQKIEELQDKAVSSKELKEAQYRLEAAEKELNEMQASYKKLEDNAARLVHEKGQLSLELKLQKVEQDKLREKLAEAISQAGYEKERADKMNQVCNNVLTQIGKTLDDAMVELTASTSSIEAYTNGLERLNLSESTLNALKRCGINDVNKLCSLTAHSLTKLVGAQVTFHIKEKLGEVGLALRAG